MKELTPEKIVLRLRQDIKNGKLGKDYTIIPREKNRLFREKYFVSDEKIKEILLSLGADDFIKSDNSDQPDFPDDVIHVFGKECSLLPKYSKNIDRIQVKLYIKFTWSTIEHRALLFISFHEWDEKKG